MLSRVSTQTRKDVKEMTISTISLRHEAVRLATFALSAVFAMVLLADAVGAAQTPATPVPPAAAAGQELPVHKIPNLGPGAEFYFSPDGTHLIGDAKRDGDTGYHVYTLAIDGTDIRRINDKGDDACSFYFPDGKRIIWTSTKDHPELAKSNYSNPSDYPQGSELYTSNLDGSDVKRLTNNNVYDAEVSIAPNGKWILFGSQRSGKMELWRSDIDGSNPVQITHLDGWEPGGSFLFRDGKTIIFRAWRSEDAKANKKGLPMELFTIQSDGSGLKQLTHDGGTNWSPFPAPDGHHYVFVKVLPPHNYEIFLGDLSSDHQVRLTDNDAFDGYPSISPDGHWLAFTSTRDSTPGSHVTGVYLMDISSLHIGPQ
jgi:Tol biopolymer transport system component